MDKSMCRVRGLSGREGGPWQAGGPAYFRQD